MKFAVVPAQNLRTVLAISTFQRALDDHAPGESALKGWNVKNRTFNDATLGTVTEIEFSRSLRDGSFFLAQRVETPDKGSFDAIGLFSAKTDTSNNSKHDFAEVRLPGGPVGQVERMIERELDRVTQNVLTNVQKLIDDPSNKWIHFETKAPDQEYGGAKMDFPIGTVGAFLNIPDLLGQNKDDRSVHVFVFSYPGVLPSMASVYEVEVVARFGALISEQTSEISDVAKIAKFLGADSKEN